VMGEISIKPGMQVLANGKVVEVLAVPTLSKVLVRDVDSGKTYTVGQGDIRAEIKRQVAVSKTGKPTVDARDFLDPEMEVEMEAAIERFDIIDRNISTSTSGRADVSALIKDLGVSQAQVYRLLKSFDADLGPISLLSEKVGRKKDSGALPAEIEGIITEAIEQYAGKGATHVSIFKLVEVMCLNAGVPCPAKKTVSVRINALKPSETVRRIDGARQANQEYKTRGGKLATGRPFEMLQIDHCIVDVIIVDRETRRAMCRPWATLGIDKHTRVVQGVYLGLHSPNSMSVALCVANAILPKQNWLNAIGLDDVEYPFYGMPIRIHCDNAKEFKSPALRSGCFRNNIRLTWRPPGTPRYGAHIERLIGTLMRKTHMLPGTTMSNVNERGDYDSEKHSCLTFDEFSKWFIREIEIYHKELHSELGVSPLVKWESCFRTQSGELTSPPIVEDQKKLLLQFMPMEHRIVNREGIKKFGLVYYSSELKLIDIGTRCEVRFDQSAIKRIWIKVDGYDDYIELMYSDMTWPDISHAELKYYRRIIREESGVRVSPEQVFALRQKNKDIVSAAQADTKKARKLREINKRRSEDPSHPLHTPVASESFVKEKIDYAVRPSILAVDDE